MQTETTNELEANQNNQQPSDAVAAELETNSNTDAQPQSAEEESTLGELDFGDGEQVAGVSTENDNGEEAKQKAIKQAAWKARQKKREQREAEAIAKAKQEKADADAKAKLEAQQAEMLAHYQEAKRGPMPDVNDPKYITQNADGYDVVDSKAYSEDVIAWHNAAPAKPQEQEQAPQVDVEQIKQQVAIESALADGIEDLKQVISPKSFDAAMEKSHAFIQSTGVDPKLFDERLAALSVESNGAFNPAKVRAVLASPAAQKEFSTAENINSQYAMINFLADLEKKYFKLSKRKGVQTSPIPETTSTGGVTSNAALRAAQEKYYKTGSMADHKALQRLRQSLK